MSKQAAKPLIFHVEDDEAWAAVVESKIGSRYDRKHFTSGEAALEQLSLKPAIVILDYHLEGQLTGLDTLKELQKRLPEAKVIMLSGQEDIQTAVDTLNHGAYDYIVKTDNAINRLKIVLRNLEKEEALQAEVVSLRFQIRRERLALYGVLVFIALASLIIYLRVCPDDRIIKFDPFGRAQSDACRVLSEQELAPKPVPVPAQ